MKNYPECDSCINQDADPDLCDSCEDADLYEPRDDSEAVEWMSVDEFKQLFRRRAA